MSSAVLLFLDIGAPELMVILLVALLLFGGDKLPELAKGLGKGIRDFKDASDGVKREINNQIENFESKKKDEPQLTKLPEAPAEIPAHHEEGGVTATDTEDNGYLANSKPINDSYVIGTDNVVLEEHPEKEKQPADYIADKSQNN